MPKITEEDLANIYPRAKSYDELQAEREQREIAGRPKFVAAKIALWASLMVPVAFAVYFVMLYLMTTIRAGSTGGALFSVSFATLSAVIGLSAVYYLYSRIDDLVSKTVASSSILYGILAVTLCAAGGMGATLQSHGYNLITAIAAATFTVFVVSFVTARLLQG